jgi:hypothetical protein
MCAGQPRLIDHWVPSHLLFQSQLLSPLQIVLKVDVPPSLSDQSVYQESPQAGRTKPRRILQRVLTYFLLVVATYISPLPPTVTALLLDAEDVKSARELRWFELVEIDYFGESGLLYPAQDHVPGNDPVVIRV